MLKERVDLQEILRKKPIAVQFAVLAKIFSWSRSIGMPTFLQLTTLLLGFPGL